MCTTSPKTYCRSRTETANRSHTNGSSEFDNSPIKDKYSLKIGADSLEVTIFRKKGGQKVGAAVEAITKRVLEEK